MEASRFRSHLIVGHCASSMMPGCTQNTTIDCQQPPALYLSTKNRKWKTHRVVVGEARSIANLTITLKSPYGDELQKSPDAGGSVTLKLFPIRMWFLPTMEPSIRQHGQCVFLLMKETSYTHACGSQNIGDVKITVDEANLSPVANAIVDKGNQIVSRRRAMTMVTQFKVSQNVGLSVGLIILY